MEIIVGIIIIVLAISGFLWYGRYVNKQVEKDLGFNDEE